MATKITDTESRRGKFFIIRRPQLHQLFTSLMSEDEQPTTVWLMVRPDAEVEPHQPERMARLELRVTSLTRDHRAKKVWFSGLGTTSAQAKRHYSGYIQLDAKLPSGVVFDLNDVTLVRADPVQLALTRRALQVGVDFAGKTIGDELLGGEIATRAINALTERAWFHSRVCPICHEPVESDQPESGGYSCPTHGFLRHGAARLIGFDPATS